MRAHATAPLAIISRRFMPPDSVIALGPSCPTATGPADLLDEGRVGRLARNRPRLSDGCPDALESVDGHSCGTGRSGCARAR